MLISQYTHLFKNNDNYIVYNSMSNALFTVDEDIYKQLNNAKLTDQNLTMNDFDKEDWDILVDKHIVINNREDEFLKYKSIIHSIRSMQHRLDLTIATTLDCNYSCFYCFEKKQKIYITDEVVENILSLIHTKTDLQHLHVTWFGGEPLMAYDKIALFNSKLKLPENVVYTTNLITNGYYLTKDVIKSLGENKIDAIQLTVDGLKETHNKRKRSAETKDTFTAVLNNIDTFMELENKIMLTIRVNLDENNKHEFIELSNFIHQRYPQSKNIRVVPAFITGNESGDCKTCNLDRDAMAQYLLQLSKQTGDKSNIYPRDIFSECTIRNRNILVIGPDGSLTKCLETVGDKDYKFGQLTKDGIQVTNRTVLNRYLFGADPLEDEECVKCGCLPICFGGCPHKRLENKFKGTKFDFCTTFNGNMESYLSQYVSLINN